MLNELLTAEDMLQAIHARLHKRMLAEECAIADAYPEAPEEEQVAMIAKIDQVAELARAWEAVGVALAHLGDAPKPCHDSPESYYGGPLRVGQ